jgi:hypothetical protein
MALAPIRLMLLISLLIGTCGALQSAHGVRRAARAMTHPQWRMLTSHSKPPSLVNTKFKDKAIVASHSDPLSPAKEKFKVKAKAKTKAKTSSAAKAMRLERILSNRGVASRSEVAKVYIHTL